jgi:serine/threonine protein kinase
MMAEPGDMPVRGDDPGIRDLDVLLRGLGADVDDALAAGAMRCGPYILLDEIGTGGFGEVFVGVRDDAAARRVAVKVLKRGVDTRDVLRRFEMEQRALARIDHPCVAAILDAGTTDDGRPWFAMPLLDGDPVTVACEEASSPLRERTRLMTMICDAMQAAHVQGIVHRDLKPANILLVRGADGTAVPKVIDFGIAKAIDPDIAGDLSQTVQGRRVGTPAYMAPEQLATEDAGADVRSDVYALGVIMAELVAGVRPAPAAGGARQLPLQPSRLLASLASSEPAAAREIATRRGYRTPEELRRALRGDIDAIVAKATMPDPAHRYRSAEAMAEDLRRMSESLPVLARSPSRSYLARRFVQRHRRAVIAAACAAVALVAISSVAVANAIRAERSAALASKQALRAEQVTGLLAGVFDSIDPEVAQGRDRTLLVELLQGTLARIGDQGASIDPKSAAEVSRIVADALLKIDRTQMAMVAVDDAMARLNAAIAEETDPARRRELRIERSALRITRGMALFNAGWAESGITRQALNDPMAEAEWRAALDELADADALGTRTALLARLRLWRIRETWPDGMPHDQLDREIDEAMSDAPLGPIEHWNYQLRKAEIQNWIAVLHDYPRAIAECEAALGQEHPVVVRGRNRMLAFSVMAAIDSRTASWGDSIQLWVTDDELREHWRATEAHANRVVEQCSRVFGPMHVQTLSARVWQMAARGHVWGASEAHESYRSLREDLINALGTGSKVLKQADMMWAGVNEGYQAAKWW